VPLWEEKPTHETEDETDTKKSKSSKLAESSFKKDSADLSEKVEESPEEKGDILSNLKEDESKILDENENREEHIKIHSDRSGEIDIMQAPMFMRMKTEGNLRYSPEVKE